MKVRLKPNLVVVNAETGEEVEALAAWAKQAEGHVFAFRMQDERTFLLSDLGPRAEACREPINVTSRSPDPAIRLISNLAHTPFELDGQPFGCVEAFWQGLKFPDERRRQEIAPLHGHAARTIGFEALEATTTEYRGQTIRVGTADHWRLMAAACWAKFNQHEPARLALLGTGGHPLVHVTKRDSRNIPGVIMADIWMKIRRGLINRTGMEEDTDDQEGYTDGNTGHTL
jgi:predicted NAD-dependent protein-ADP-ribosyltransferase YbiA (DUF1768 family)